MIIIRDVGAFDILAPNFIKEQTFEFIPNKIYNSLSSYTPFSYGMGSCHYFGSLLCDVCRANFFLARKFTVIHVIYSSNGSLFNISFLLFTH